MAEITTTILEGERVARIVGTSTADRIFPMSDRLKTGDFTDDHHVFGQDGDDTIRDGAGINRLFGGRGKDMLQGAANDRLAGGADADFLQINSAEDVRLSGGAGDDTIRVGFSISAVGQGASEIIGGSGSDRMVATYAEPIRAVIIDLPEREVFLDVLDQGANTTRRGLVAEVRGVEVFVGDFGNDVMTGDQRAQVFDGGDGADTLNGGGGGDKLFGGRDGDTLRGQQGADTLYAGANPLDPDAKPMEGSAGDDLSGGKKADTLISDTGSDTLFGGRGDDAIYSISGRDSIVAGGGDDAIFFALVAELGGDHPDIPQGRVQGNSFNQFFRIDGGAGSDTASFEGYLPNTELPRLESFGFHIDLSQETATDRSEATAGPIHLKNIEAVRGTKREDILIGDCLRNTLAGAAGDDEITGGAGADRLFGGRGQDTIIADQGSDILVGGLDKDTFVIKKDGKTDTIPDLFPSEGDRIDLSDFDLSFRNQFDIVQVPGSRLPEVFEVFIDVGPGRPRGSQSLEIFSDLGQISVSDIEGAIIL